MGAAVIRVREEITPATTNDDEDEEDYNCSDIES